MSDPNINAMDAEVAAYYQALQNQLQSGVGATQKNFNTASGQVGSIYDQMTRDLTTQANATAGTLGNQFSMLGIGAAQDAATQDLRGQLNQSLISAARRRASEMSGLTEQGAAYGRVGNEAVANVGREGARIRTETRTKLEQALAALQGEMEAARAQVDVAKIQGDAEIAAARASRRGGGGGGGGSPLDMLRAQLLGLQILEKQQGLEEGPESPWGDRGQLGLNQFMGQPSDWWERQAGPKFRGALGDIIDWSSSQDVVPGFNPYHASLGRVNAAPSYINRDALRAALGVFYGRE